MAKTIAGSMNLSANLEGVAADIRSSSFTAQVTGDQLYHANPLVGTSSESLTFAPVNQSQRYRLAVRNMDAANEIQISLNTGTDWHMVVPPGEAIYFNVNSGSGLRFKAIGAPCLTEILAVEF